MDLAIPKSLLDECYGHGGETYPEEACGVLSGPQGEPRVDARHPFENRMTRLHQLDPVQYPRTGKDGYHMDPLAFLKLEKKLREDGREVKAIYHSHPDCGAYFSQEDTDQALWEGQPRHPGIVYLVCGVKQQRPDGAILAWFNPATGGFNTKPVE
ncbi:MAG: M67 family metallopeptidase [Deltaproteobacteria bacterium]|nr:M67 family metallopeptidase [Deltaproteobacteria bacterium]